MATAAHSNHHPIGKRYTAFLPRPFQQAFPFALRGDVADPYKEINLDKLNPGSLILSFVVSRNLPFLFFRFPFLFSTVLAPYLLAISSKS